MFGSVEAQARVLVTTVRATNYRGSTFLEGRLQRAAVSDHEVQSWSEGGSQARPALHRWERTRPTFAVAKLWLLLRWRRSLGPGDDGFAT